MGSFTGLLQRPSTAVAVASIAALSAEFPDRLPSTNSHISQGLAPSSSLSSHSPSPNYGLKSWASQVLASSSLDSSFWSRVRIMAPKADSPIVYSLIVSKFLFGSKDYWLSSTSSHVLRVVYRSANLSLGQLPKSINSEEIINDYSGELFRWHSPKMGLGHGGDLDCLPAKSGTVVVLLGWLGAKQKHLKRYADWYTARGFHAVTFTFPMSDIVSYKVGGKAEQQLELFANHLGAWVGGDCERKLVFHTFSNTGWLTYGVILEKFHNEDSSMISRIKGCIVDSAPVAAPDPQVWASGFSAAFLKKQSIATKGSLVKKEPGMEMALDAKFSGNSEEPKAAVAEAILLAVLEKFFEVVLNIPTVNRRLLDVVGLLSSKQPKCPQLYIYSSADRVIPAKSVESFIEEQRRAGHEVRACDFMFTPHVDHFRNDPKLYTSQLTSFLEECVLDCKRDS
ncbi:hypothetical protein AMTRI_Chr09g12460 [Amborella trichopoda]|uniref:Uncharacterized protein n=1 Tax=Amborella trichopoda TaxID=13333 RepID=W1PHA7_AMBTC|nr:transmembrane protein 53 [Amborella trichopoda]XP_011624614.1 transmembrane protein 53 [Amborella trichopoda]XP_020525287.1 transmembrane protein 53 [Amborella trichopoda]XP_020525288.1 transmembrane protein 53 [Amborella trichopoda]ERN09377.1 hypothetical protein AMTR_s00029p00024320 [Amborella trichopoda]|eukprot:XP_006847796.1 transmembrane protein 53 [Amborella trichopoda]